MALPMKTSMRAAKAMKGMKAMKAMKTKKVSVIAKGKYARAAVFKGTKQKTATGMTKDKLMKSKTGKIVSKARSAAAKRRYANGLGRWTKAVAAARKALGVRGFVAVNGKTAQGKAIYAKAKALYSAGQ